MTDEDAIAVDMRRRLVRRAVRKYIFLRTRSTSSTLGESGMVWMIDAERSLDALPYLDREILFASLQGFTIPEIAKRVHKGHATVERHLPKAHALAADMLEAQGVL